MEKKVLVLAPYDDNLIKALVDFSHTTNAIVQIIGSKEKVLEVFLKNNLEIEKFQILDLLSEIEICLKAKEIMINTGYDFIVLGNITKPMYKKVLNIPDKEDIGLVNVVDIPTFNHYLFLSSYNNSNLMTFDERKKAIVQAHNLIEKMTNKETNVALVSNCPSKPDFVEAKIIKLLFKEERFDRINIVDYFSLYDLFSIDALKNIYINEINLLIMKNFDSYKTFIDTVSIFLNLKIAYFNVSKDVIAIDSKEARSYQNILFSLYILDQAFFKQQKNDVQLEKVKRIVGR